MADVSVPCWDAVDVEELCEEAELIAFDLDSTLARSKKPMKDDMANIFSILTSLIDVAVITGGKYALLQSQVVDRLTGQANRSKLHLMPTSGTRYYRWDGRRWTLVFAHDLSDEAANRASGAIMRGANASRTGAVRSPSPLWDSPRRLRPRRHGTPRMRKNADWLVRLRPNCRNWRSDLVEPAVSTSPSVALINPSPSANSPTSSGWKSAESSSSAIEWNQEAMIIRLPWRAPERSR